MQKTIKVISANLNGVRSATKKGFLVWLASQEADFVCVQELKAQAADLSPEMLNTPCGLTGYFAYAEKAGYSGVGVYTRRVPDAVTIGFGCEEFDREGRVVRLDFSDMRVISVYLPSGSSSPERQAAKLRFMAVFYPYLQALLQDGKPTLVCGDWNIAHQNIDLKNWKGNLKNSGFLPEERQWLSDLFIQQKWVDVYRHLYPEQIGYTWWSNRGQAYKNDVGWRIDYHLASQHLAARAQQAWVYKTEKFSDHAPLIIEYSA